MITNPRHLTTGPRLSATAARRIERAMARAGHDCDAFNGAGPAPLGGLINVQPYDRISWGEARDILSAAGALPKGW